jgi:DNA repair protein RecO (recombination protein O)
MPAISTCCGSRGTGRRATDRSQPPPGGTVPVMAIRHDSGIVLRSYPFGEADKVVVLLSPLHGKLRTVAKGVRKTKSRFGGRLESFMEVDVVLYEGRNLDLITQAELRSAFPSLRRDLEAVAAASTMAEVVDAVAQENEPSIALFELLRRGLAALDAGRTSPDVLTAFLLQLLSVQGLAPALTRCASCGQTSCSIGSAVAAGGIVCGECRPEGSVRLRSGLVPIWPPWRQPTWRRSNPITNSARMRCG